LLADDALTPGEKPPLSRRRCEHGGATPTEDSRKFEFVNFQKSWGLQVHLETTARASAKFLS